MPPDPDPRDVAAALRVSIGLLWRRGTAPGGVTTGRLAAAPSGWFTREEPLILAAAPLIEHLKEKP